MGEGEMGRRMSMGRGNKLKRVGLKIKGGEDKNIVYEEKINSSRPT